MAPARFDHVIVDRDGVVNREPCEGWTLAPEQWVWESGAREGLALLGAHGIEISIVTNQSCIARGIATADAVQHLHAWLIAQAREHDAHIARVLVCPHIDADACECRKPKAALCVEAVRASGIDPARTLVIGDACRDLHAGRGAGLETALVRTGKGSRDEGLCRELADWVFDDLHHAARFVVGQDRSTR